MLAGRALLLAASLLLAGAAAAQQPSPPVNPETIQIGLSTDRVAITADFSGADLTHLVDSAAELAMAHAVKTGKVRPIGSRDFAAALKEVRATTQAWFDTAKNYALYANEGGLYDDLLTYLKRR